MENEIYMNLENQLWLAIQHLSTVTLYLREDLKQKNVEHYLKIDDITTKLIKEYKEIVQDGILRTDEGNTPVCPF